VCCSGALSWWLASCPVPAPQLSAVQNFQKKHISKKLASSESDFLLFRVCETNMLFHQLLPVQTFCLMNRLVRRSEIYTCDLYIIDAYIHTYIHACTYTYMHKYMNIYTRISIHMHIHESTLTHSYALAKLGHELETSS